MNHSADLVIFSDRFFFRLRLTTLRMSTNIILQGEAEEEAAPENLSKLLGLQKIPHYCF